jgi:hypothetical protein
MNSVALQKEENALPTTERTLTYWPVLQPDEQAFVAAYIENAYSLPEACAALKMNRTVAGKMLRTVTIRKAIAEVQKEFDNLDFLNEAWVKAQLLRIYPMAVGDEPVPYITSAGEEAEGRKFDGHLAMKIVEYVAPKAQKQPSVNISINNISTLSDEDLEKIAMQGAGRVVSEQ